MMVQKLAIARSRTRRWRVAGLTLVVLLVTGLVAPLTQAAPAAQGSVFRVGYLGPLGSATANGALLAIDQINSVGGVRAAGGVLVQLELVTLEEAPTVETMPAALEELRGQGVGVLLGPDTNAQITPDTIAALAATGLPVFTPATQNAMTDVDTANVLFRTRAPERVLSNAIATYLVADLGVTSVAAVQTEVEFTESLMDFEAALAALGRSLAEIIQLPGGSDLLDEIPGLLGTNPRAVVMWGAPEDAAALLDALREAGWGGIFAYRNAEAAVHSGVLSAKLGDGMLGFDSWSYADALPAGRIFLHDYVVAFGEVPGPLAVAAYDAMWALRAAMIEGGVTPTGLRAALIGGTARTLVQGVLRPADFGNGDLARLGVVYRVEPRGGSTVVARFDDMERLGLDEPGVLPEPVVPPTPTTVPEQPTAVMEGVWIEVTANVLNVRNGPGFNFDQIGQIKAGERYRVLGASADYSWLVIEFRGGVGWVRTEYTTVLGEISQVPIVQVPPTPIPALSPTPALPAIPDIVIDSVVLSPSQPIPNRPFTATVTVRNAGGGAAGRFAVAATWDPGAVYTSAFVEGLAGGQSVPVQLSGTLTGTGVYQVAVVADLNNEVAELNEDNNLFNVPYRVDYPLLANQVNIELGPNTQWDMFGGTPDFLWDGYNIAMLNGAQIGQLSGVTYENVHYDMLTPAVINNAVGVGTDKVQPGAVFGMTIPEGRRAVVRVDNRSGETVWLSYRVYNDTP